MVELNKILRDDGRIQTRANVTGTDSADIPSDASDFRLQLFSYDKDEARKTFATELDVTGARALHGYLSQFDIVGDPTLDGATPFSAPQASELRELIERSASVDGSHLLALLKRFAQLQDTSLILSTLSDEQLQNLDATIAVTRRRAAISYLEEFVRLDLRGDSVCEAASGTAYEAGQPEKVFHNWVEQNLWAVGVTVVRRYDRRAIGIASECDLLLETIDGFVDLIELKRPKMALLRWDQSHNCYCPSALLSLVLGQVVYYLKVIADQRLVLQDETELSVFRPRVRIIAGSSGSMKKDEREAVRGLNAQLAEVDIITFDQLVTMAKRAVDVEDDGG